MFVLSIPPLGGYVAMLSKDKSSVKPGPILLWQHDNATVEQFINVIPILRLRVDMYGELGEVKLLQFNFLPVPLEGNAQNRTIPYLFRWTSSLFYDTRN